MSFPGRPLRSFVSRVIRRRGASDPLTHSANNELETTITDVVVPETQEQDKPATQMVTQDSSANGSTLSQSATENDSLGRTDFQAADEPSESSSPSSTEPSSDPEGDSDDESAAESQRPPEDHKPSSLADLLANPLPPALSVDNLISETLGNIFQKKVTKDHSILALLDDREEIDMRDLADELREFAIAIGATES